MANTTFVQILLLSQQIYSLQQLFLKMKGSGIYIGIFFSISCFYKFIIMNVMVLQNASQVSTGLCSNLLCIVCFCSSLNFGFGLFWYLQEQSLAPVHQVTSEDNSIVQSNLLTLNLVFDFWVAVFNTQLVLKFAQVQARAQQKKRYNKNRVKRALERLNCEKKVHNTVDCIMAFNENCGICMEDFDDDHDTIMRPLLRDSFNKVILFPCGHSFHYKCVKKWFELKQECPQCKHNYDQYKEHLV